MINDDYAEAAMEAEFAEDEDIRRAALGFISEAWSEAIANGVDADAVAHAAMFTALADLVAAYGEDAVAKLAEGLPDRIQRGDYTVNRVLQ
ncbi:MULTISPECIES: hypothetical protein [Stappiaceae]|jgi:uncharacterized membrane protein|uniref:Uncharacterized protein n=2 Tax=Roseibium alexandrii TaxID=388408 RepID=A0A0M7A5C2_9HYPH|nr:MULTISPECIES: hypothetical protein [Stappiaceae]EEE45300.1 hypothetical protein SADFL11_2589 [Roseibium alexandrii DFL-11]OJJ13282.1 hypothetical protein BKI51_04375 [Alphaproteobacteria bacterium AO1-B]CTQ70325.1 hypothetical protein LAX5112_02468 [Roseibium alexandrii]